MKTKGGGVPGKTPTYATAAKCARLRRRLARLFHLARASHAFTQRLNSLEHPEVARLQQELMRTRLQIMLRLKQSLQPGSQLADTFPVHFMQDRKSFFTPLSC